jgi:hypothetical protein
MKSLRAFRIDKRERDLANARPQTWFEKVSLVGGWVIAGVILLLILRILMTFVFL